MKLAHIARRDVLLNVLQTLAETILSFHPAVHWTAKQIRAERENCCDDLAVSICEGREGYARALLALEESRLASSFALGTSGSDLKKRIERLLCPAAEPNTVAAAALAMVAALALVLSPAAISAMAQTEKSKQQESQPSACRQFAEDVAYIIEPKERERMQALSDEECGRFIEQFWARRDLTPETKDNAVKTEHYRRLAWTTARFGPGPGERKRAYIQFGPPDEIESHSGKFEIWIWRAGPGVPGPVIRRFELTPDNKEAPIQRQP